ncbi:hypothetical protein VNO78_14267 [Psophocarpus tetragonolobus]|uniref:Uncharacterized protein n=1 Tax=Psophocarpus tetragonolobus TaxID=3891 RepID=A0AAN9SQ19_PSOTE
MDRSGLKEADPLWGTFDPRSLSPSKENVKNFLPPIPISRAERSTGEKNEGGGAEMNFKGAISLAVTASFCIYFELMEDNLGWEFQQRSAVDGIDFEENDKYALIVEMLDDEAPVV